MSLVGEASSPRNRRSWSRRLAFAAIVCFALGLLLEGGAWLAFLIVDGKPFARSQVVAERAGRLAESPIDVFFSRREESDAGNREILHPYFGYALDPRGLKRPEPASSLLRIEECGLHFPRRSVEKCYVGIFGGSVAQLFSAQGTPALTRLLRDLPFVGGREIVYVAAAAGGWKQPQQHFALTWLLALDAELDLLVNLDGFNEVASDGVENHRLGVFPAFPPRWASRIERVPDANTRLLLARLFLASQDRIEWARQCGAGLLASSVSGNLLWRARDNQYQREIATCTRELVERPSTTTGPLTQGPAFDRGDKAHTMDELVAVWERSSRLMGELCRARGIPYFHFLQPNQYVPDSKPLSDEEKKKAWRKDQPLRRGVLDGWPKLQVAGERLAAAGESFHDISLVFKDVTDTLYIDDCCHFNAKGNELVAAAIAEVLRKELPSALPAYAERR